MIDQSTNDPSNNDKIQETNGVSQFRAENKSLNVSDLISQTFNETNNQQMYQLIIQPIMETILTKCKKQ